MKGISAMIATVLLIAFTIAIGGIVSVWLTGLTTTQTQQVTNQSTGQIKCTPSLSIDRVESNTAAGASLINVTISNPSQQTISPVNITVVAANASVYILSNITSLSSGTANFSSVGTWTVLPSMVRATGICAGLPVSFTCKPTDSCWRGS